MSINCAMNVLTLDGDTGMKKGRGVDDWAMQSQLFTCYESPRQKAWLVERHNAILGAGQLRTETQMRKESTAASSSTVLAIVAFMHNTLTCINGCTPCQALLGGQPHILPPLEGGYCGDLDTRGQHNITRIPELAAIMPLHKQRRRAWTDTKQSHH